MRIGDQKLASREYAKAIEFYQAALNYTSNPAATNPQIAEAYYRWADKYYLEKNYREATEKFESVISVVPNYRDSRKRREDSYQKALRRVAILPFKNNASNGAKYTQQLTDNIINNCIKANLKYATFMNRAHLDLILEEHKLAMAGVVDPDKATKIGKLEGIHYFITGTITQVYPKNSSPSFVDQTHNKVYSEKDTAGNNLPLLAVFKYRAVIKL
jgi:tetratricopeptide (TPR) repeat protein